MPKRRVYDVKPGPKGEGWQGKARGAERASVAGETKAEVVKRTTKVAKNQALSQVVIRKKDMTIQEERTYGKDPYPPSG
jgi:hypothetical protein